jgi:hypothetical protein
MSRFAPPPQKKINIIGSGISEIKYVDEYNLFITRSFCAICARNAYKSY